MPARPLGRAAGQVQRQTAKPGSPRSASNPPEGLILDDQIDGDLVLELPSTPQQLDHPLSGESHPRPRARLRRPRRSGLSPPQ